MPVFAQRVAALNTQLQQQTTLREQERASHNESVQHLQYLQTVATERHCMASEDACSSRTRHSELVAQLDAMQTESVLQAAANEMVQQQLRVTTVRSFNSNRQPRVIQHQFSTRRAGDLVEGARGEEADD
jgi:hypothetical protein